MTTSERVDIVAGSTSLALAVAEDGRLHQVGFGATGSVPAELPFPVGLYPLALPTFGEEVDREPALRVTHADGVLGTRLVFEGSTVEPSSVGSGFLHTVRLVDRVAPLAVELHHRTWPDQDVIEAWMVVLNRGAGSISLHEAFATAPAFAGSDPYLTHWGGGWAAEWTETTEPIRYGVKTIASNGGVRPVLTMPPIVLLAPDGPATETTGTVAACTVLWGGDCRFDVESALHGGIRVMAGHQHRGADRHLDAGESFETPHALWTWSTNGVGPTSRALHSLAREHLVRDGRRTRATVANTWEAVGMRIDTPTLLAQVDGAAGIGAELFLLDDGWFGVEHPRDDDDRGLGDWDVDPAKFPDGLDEVIDRTISAGMRFGLWVEPEMVNPLSELYREHPDWVVAEPGRQRREFRQQLVLDLCLADVRAFVVDVFDRILDRYPGISYFKWDANRDVFESWSSTLAADRQSHHGVDRVRATSEVMAEVARRHPEVELMLCASGGGRSELATLAWFHEVWTSDDTDPVDRIRIQWGASHLLPASVLGAHVTRWGQRPIPFACSVAMAGRFGFDLDVTALDAQEREACRRASQDYTAVREVVQQGDLYRLVSPLGNDRCAIAYVDPAGDRAVVFVWVWPTGTSDGDAPAGTDAAGQVPSGVSVPMGGVRLPEPLVGRDWVVTDRTPGSSGSVGGDGDVWSGPDEIAWPAGPFGSRVVELRLG